MNSGITVSPRLVVSVWTADGTTFAELAGELDIASAPTLREQLLGLLRPGSSRLVIDLSKVSFCDASGLAVLVSTGRRAKLLGGFLHLAAVSPQADRVLHVTGLHRHLTVSPTVHAVVASPLGAQHNRTGAVAVGNRPAMAGHGRGSKPAWQSRVPGNSGDLRKAVTALLAHADAWHDADPSRRFTPALSAMARACERSDNVALDAAARSLMSALARHPLTHSPAVAETATSLRRVLGPA
jgi:anti-sigma B factor antagonist